MSTKPLPKYTGKKWTVEPLDMSFDKAVKKTVQPVKADKKEKNAARSRDVKDRK